MREEQIQAYDSKDFFKYNGRRIRQKSLRSLSGLLRGVCVDGVVNESEQSEIRAWIEENRDCARYHPWDLVIEHLESYLSDGKIDLDEIEDMIWLADKLSEWTDLDDLIKDRIQELHGIFHGILADQTLSDDELKSLRDWVFDHEYLSGSYPYDEIASLLVNAFKDGEISSDEREQIMFFLGEFVDVNNSTSLSKEKLLELKSKYSINGICAVDPEIEFEGKTFCVTGEFKHGSRAEICDLITNAGGSVKSSVSKKTDYLVVGGAGNPCWAYACYGRKVEHAVELRKQGAKIVIVSERDFCDAL